MVWSEFLATPAGARATPRSGRNPVWKVLCGKTQGRLLLSSSGKLTTLSSSRAVREGALQDYASWQFRNPYSTKGQQLSREFIGAAG